MSSHNGSTNGTGYVNGSGGDSSEPDWDPHKAQELLGKTVVISITMVDDEEALVGVWESFGTIESANYDDGVIGVALKGQHEGENTALPPVTAAFEPAEPGTYTLTGSEETVVDPDYLVHWTISVPVEDEDDELV